MVSGMIQYMDFSYILNLDGNQYEKAINEDHLSSLADDVCPFNLQDVRICLLQIHT